MAAYKFDPLRKVREHYDVIVIGSGLGGMTCAKVLSRMGHSVLLLEQHNNFGGLATWFHRKGGHIFDISLHGFPFNMKKSCRIFTLGLDRDFLYNKFIEENQELYLYQIS